MTTIFEFRKLTGDELPPGALTAYAVSVKGECGEIGMVAKYETTSHRYVHSGRVISRTFHAMRWAMGTERDDVTIRHAYFPGREEAASSLLRAYDLRTNEEGR